MSFDASLVTMLSNRIKCLEVTTIEKGMTLRERISLESGVQSGLRGRMCVCVCVCVCLGPTLWVIQAGIERRVARDGERSELENKRTREGNACRCTNMVTDQQTSGWPRGAVMKIRSFQEDSPLFFKVVHS